MGHGVHAALIRWHTLGFYIALIAGLTAVACGKGVTLSPAPTEPAGAPTQATLLPSTPVATTTPDVDPASSFGILWKTDFSKRTVPLREIRYLGLSRVPIDPAETLAHEPIAEVSKRLSGLQPVIVVEVNGEVRAYPQSMLIFVATEVVNDTLGGVPIAVTW